MPTILPPSRPLTIFPLPISVSIHIPVLLIVVLTVILQITFQRQFVYDLRAKYSLKKNVPFAKIPSAQQRVAYRDQLQVYVPNKLTEQLVADDIILETFDRSQWLYQYLKWTLRISTMARTMALLQGQNKYTVMLCHTELHDRRARDLYIQNDVVSPKA